MKVRLYDGGAKYSIDRYSLYFPYPKSMRNQAKGTFIGCSQNKDGNVIKCVWDDLDDRYNNSLRRLGKRVPLSTMSSQFQKWATNLEKLWNEAISKNTDEAWEAWVYED